MRLFILTCAIALLFITSAWAQESGDTPRHPEDPNAVFVGSFTVAINSQLPGTSASIATDGGTRIGTAGFIAVFNVSGGGTDYMVPVDSIYFMGDGGGIDNTTTIAFFDMLAQAVVAQGIAQGYTPCPASCSTPKIARVYLASCVKRTGQAATTHFSACVPESFCYREYSICCPNGVATPVLTKIIHEGTSCSGSPGSQCEPTCP